MPVVKHLMTPGPTPVPQPVLDALALPMIHHRTAEFRQAAAKLNEDLAYLFGAAQPPCTIVGSGTAAMEAAIVSVLGCFRGANRKALCLSNGKFAERWVKVCKAWNIATSVLQVEYGQAVTPEQVEAALKADATIGAVILVHSETSTATVTDLEPIAKIAREHDALVMVDGITSVGAFEVEMDKWGLDVLVTGSQKALMNPPGLGFTAVSERGWASVARMPTPPCSFYLDLRAYQAKLADADSPYTAGVSLVRSVGVAAGMIREEGRENVWKRTSDQAKACRAAAEAMGVKLFSSRPADSVTALVLPEGVEDKKLRKDLTAKHSVQLAGGQGTMEGKIVRISHMGGVTMDDLNATIAGLVDCLADQGFKSKCSADEALAAAGA